MKRVLSAALAVGMTGTVLLSTPGFASAKSEVVYGPIAARLGTLNAKYHDLGQHSPLTSSDKAALDEILSDDISGLTNLNAEIQATTSKRELAQYKLDVYKDYRVYTLVGPQFALSTDADAGTTAAAGLQSAEPVLQKDANTQLKQAEYRNLVLNLGNAQKVLPGIGPAVLAQTPFTNYGPVIDTNAKDLARGLAALDKAEKDASLIEG
jgi:hypothetical protein